MAKANTRKPDLPVKLFTDQKTFEAWLAAHGATSAGLWLRLAKKAATLEALSYQEALESALCYGWIDGQRKVFDEQTWIQRFTPRGPKSSWSKINRTKAEELIERGRMRPPGLAAIDGAKRDGRWDAAYDSHSTSVPPRDFLAALNKSPKAKAFFATVSRQNRYAVLYRIQTAKKAETRQKRIALFVAMLAKHETLYP